MGTKVLSPPKHNLTKAQNSAIRELKRDRDHVVLTADKGVAMVIMDRQDYISKANNLLSQNTYKTIQQDPTNTIKNKLITILKRVKSQTGLNNQTYKAMYPKVVYPQVLWPPQDPQDRYSTKANCIKLWICYLWGGQRTCQNP